MLVCWPSFTGTISASARTPRASSVWSLPIWTVHHEYLIPKDKHVLVHDGQVVNKGESIVDGAGSARHPASAGY
jgi:DNA-directed RNA polymerase subunit beta'